MFAKEFPGKESGGPGRQMVTPSPQIFLLTTVPVQTFPPRHHILDLGRNLRGLRKWYNGLVKFFTSFCSAGGYMSGIPVLSKPTLLCFPYSLLFCVVCVCAVWIVRECECACSCHSTHKWRPEQYVRCLPLSFSDWTASFPWTELGNKCYFLKENHKISLDFQFNYFNLFLMFI